ncbi:MAG: hypothetical protein HY927_14900 [Elusimicrobia bacterium]|nr:hypothetical protein [Elusimicrobiota bacterium]
MAGGILDTVLLLALPASGKSEVRRYIKHLSQEKRKKDFHMGPSVQLDDFPYVHMMRRVDDELVSRGKARLFFQSPERPFRDPLDWGTLIQLLNEDYEFLTARPCKEPSSAALHLFDRIDRASKAVGAPARLAGLDAATRQAVAEPLEKEARELWNERKPGQKIDLKGKTLVIEFARGGPQGSRMPLPAPFGYQYSLAQVSKQLLNKACILYVWVTPEESRRKNADRTDPNDPGSILHHGVPLDVMLNDYGCDDMDWLEAHAERRGTVAVKAHGKTFHLPCARFDNRVDKTSFLRAEAKKWKAGDVRAVHEGLKAALDKLAGLAAPGVSGADLPPPRPKGSGLAAA